VYVDQLARRFQARGHEVHVVYTRPPDQAAANPDYPVSWVPHSEHIIINALPVAWEIVRLVRRKPPDLCFVTGVEGALLADLISRRIMIVYGEFHPYLPPSLSLNRRELPLDVFKKLYRLRFFYSTRHIARKANHVITTSQFMRRQVIETYQVQPGRVTAIHTGVDTAVYRPIPAPGSPEILQFICVARLELSKGIDILLEAFAKVSTLYPTSRLVVVGGGTVEPYRARAEQLKIAGRVRFTGRLPQPTDVADQLWESQIFVLPSRVEGYGNVLLEAMASRLAVIASDVGGIPEIVAHEQTGLLVPPEQPEKLAAAMIRLVQDVDLRQRLAEAGYRQVAEQEGFTWDASVTAHCNLFQNLVSGIGTRKETCEANV
jgi:glycosyltransferase involved in cell wall biosynthesis